MITVMIITILLFGELIIYSLKNYYIETCRARRAASTALELLLFDVDVIEIKMKCIAPLNKNGII